MRRVHVAALPPLPRLSRPPVSHSLPSLPPSLPQTNLEGGVSGAHDEMLRHIAGVGDFDAQSGGDFISHAGFAGKSNGTQREDENESRSGSDNVDGGSGDDNDLDHPPKKKRYHRHTPWQIQELEACALSL